MGSEDTGPRPSEAAARIPDSEKIRATVAFLKRLRDQFGVGLPYENILEKGYSAFLKGPEVVLDVGAHGGRHLVPMANRVRGRGQVIGFEPLPFAIAAIADKIQGMEDTVTLHQVALGNEDGETDFVVADGVPEESGLRERIYNVPEKTTPRVIRVQVRRLDQFTADLERLDYIKIDIEGGEIDCLKGASDTIERFRPILSVEYGYAGYSAYGHARTDLYDLLTARQYHLFDLFANIVPDRETWEQICDVVYWDYFAVPDEKIGMFLSAFEVDG